MNELIAQLQTMPVAQLQAMYNSAWRKAHNGIHAEQHRHVMTAIEFVAGTQAISITGNGGHYEFERTQADE